MGEFQVIVAGVMILVALFVGIAIGRTTARGRTVAGTPMPTPEPEPEPTGPLAELRQLLRPLPNIIVELQRLREQYFQQPQQTRLTHIQNGLNAVLGGLHKGLNASEGQVESQLRHATSLLHGWLPNLQQLADAIVNNPRSIEASNLAAGWRGAIENIQTKLPWSLQEAEEWMARTFPDAKPKLRSFDELKAEFAASAASEQ